MMIEEEEGAMFLAAEAAVRRFAKRCIEHPRLEEDPQCIIATEREAYIKEMDKREKPIKTIILNGNKSINNKKQKGRIL